jgi:hypothetical protein
MPTLNWWIGAIVYRSRLWLLHDECHPHKYPSLIQCLRFAHIVFAKLLLLLLLLQSQQNCYCYCYRYCYYCYRYYQNFQTTVLLNPLLQRINFPGVVELTTQSLRLINILWLPLCRINKLGEILPAKTVSIPYTCGLSRPFSGAISGEHSSIY